MGEGGGGCNTTTGAASVLTYSCGGPWVRGGGLQHNHRGCLGANIQLWGPWVRGGGLTVSLLFDNHNRRFQIKATITASDLNSEYQVPQFVVELSYKV